jgi:hypothetical protein
VGAHHQPEGCVEVRSVMRCVRFGDEGLELSPCQVPRQQAVAVMVDQVDGVDEVVQVGHPSLPVALVMPNPRWSHSSS